MPRCINYNMSIFSWHTVQLTLTAHWIVETVPGWELQHTVLGIPFCLSHACSLSQDVFFSNSQLFILLGLKILECDKRWPNVLVKPKTLILLAFNRNKHLSMRKDVPELHRASLFSLLVQMQLGRRTVLYVVWLEWSARWGNSIYIVKKLRYLF